MEVVGQAMMIEWIGNGVAPCSSPLRDSRKEILGVWAIENTAMS